MFINPFLDVMTEKVIVKFQNINKKTADNVNLNIEVVAKHTMWKWESIENIGKNIMILGQGIAGTMVLW